MKALQTYLEDALRIPLGIPAVPAAAASSLHIAAEP